MVRKEHFCGTEGKRCIILTNGKTQKLRLLALLNWSQPIKIPYNLT